MRPYKGSTFKSSRPITDTTTKRAPVRKRYLYHVAVTPDKDFLWCFDDDSVCVVHVVLQKQENPPLLVGFCILAKYHFRYNNAVFGIPQRFLTTASLITLWRIYSEPERRNYIFCRFSSFISPFFKCIKNL